MVNVYKKQPSELLHIEDEYLAFCIDEAVALIITRLKDGEELQFKKVYNSFSDLYKNYN